MKLVSFDAAKKIALIKEIRGWLNLGLKEVNKI
jgi:ribosomal protein L7/L12